ncbi:MAG: hypothetical protein OXH28_00485 [bacterium]|nr:hypothetical protein [bacterium]
MVRGPAGLVDPGIPVVAIRVVVSRGILARSRGAGRRRLVRWRFLGGI